MKIKLLFCILWLLGDVAFAANIKYIEDSKLKVGINNLGQIAYLENKGSSQGNIIDKPSPIFKMVCHENNNWEGIVSLSNQSCVVNKEQNKIQIIIETLKAERQSENSMDFKLC